MKKKLTLTLLVILSNVLMAAAITPFVPEIHKQEKAFQVPFQGSKLNFNEKCVRANNEPAVAAMQKQPRYAATTGANGEIRVPSGEAYDYLYSYYMIDAWGESYVAGKHVKIYYDQSDNSVYLEKFLDDYMGDCYYVGGKLIEGDLQNGVLEMQTRKAVYYSYGEWLMLIVAEYNEKTGDFYVYDGVDTFTLTIKDGVISNYTSYLALASINNDTDVYWLVSKICYDPIDMSSARVAEIPAAATLSHYYMTVNNSDESVANVYRDNNDFYFNNIFGEGFTFLGTLGSDNKIEIKLPQLMNVGDEFVYLNTYYEVNNSYYKPGEDEKIYFDYDPKTGDISYYDGAAITLFSGNKFLYSSYDDPYSSLDLVKFTESEEPIIVPVSASQELYSMSTGYDEQGNHKAGLMKIARDGNSIYFMRVDNNNYDVVMKGDLDPVTNKVAIQLSQIVGIKGSTFLGLSLAKQSIVLIEDYYADDYNEIRYVEDTDSPAEIYIDYDPSTGIYQCNDVLAIIDAQRHTVSIPLIKPTYAPISDVASIPSTAEINDFIFSRDGDVNHSTVVKIARDGNDFYFVHPAPNAQIEEMIIHGVLNSNGKIEISVPQLVAHGAKEQGVFMRVGTSERVGTPEDADVQMRFWKVFNDDAVNEIQINFDEGLHQFDYDGYFSFIQFSDNSEVIKATEPYYKPYVLGAKKPAAPTDLELIDKTEDYWGNGQRYRLDFVIPCQDVDGKFLPYDNLYFRLYFDDEVFLFTPDDYSLTFMEEITDIPFNHPASSEIPHPIWNSNMRQVYLYSLPKYKIGVQSCYIYDNIPNFGDITYIPVQFDSLSGISDDQPVSIQYFDIYGRQIYGQHSGLIIVKSVFADGKVITEKKLID